jgi:hypothetical protein
VSRTQPQCTTRSPSRASSILAGRAWFDGLQLTSDASGRTTIAGPVADQAALHGLLARIRDLGLPLLTVRRADPDDR